MKLIFYKYQGTGNDFVILDNREGIYTGLTQPQIAKLCDRRFGIGADGLMLLDLVDGYDFKMTYFNADGGESSMCGNGGRCLTRFAADMGITKTSYHFIAVDGPHESFINDDGSVSLRMNDVTNIETEGDHFILNTGSPHYVTFANDVMSRDVKTDGQKIRNGARFKGEGINVNFVEQMRERDHIIVRTYERGVEDETFSCGTGVTAAALVCCHNDNGYNRVEVETKGGRLAVDYQRAGNHYTNIYLVGPANMIFNGEISI